MNLSNPQTYQWDYTVAPNSYTLTDRYDGVGDPTIGAQYLVLDKSKDNMGLTVYGLFSPSTAASDASVSEIKTNGAITTNGTNGKSGNGYTRTNVGTALSLPVAGIGNVYGVLDYISNGSKSSAGVTTQYGSNIKFEFGLEYMASEKTLVRPYFRFNSTGSGSSGTTQLASSTGYDAGVIVTNDVSKNVSVSVQGEYNSMGTQSLNYANGNVFTYSGTGFTYGVRGSFFF